jgi:hypothetical protein
LNKKAAREKIKDWLEFPKPSELDPVEVWAVLEAIGFKFLGKNSNHTTYRWNHISLQRNSTQFKYGNIGISVGHSKSKKTVIRIDSVKKLLTALQLFIEWEEEQ